MSCESPSSVDCGAGSGAGIAGRSGDAEPEADGLSSTPQPAIGQRISSHARAPQTETRQKHGSQNEWAHIVGSSDEDATDMGSEGVDASECGLTGESNKGGSASPFDEPQH